MKEFYIIWMLQDGSQKVSCKSDGTKERYSEKEMLLLKKALKNQDFGYGGDYFGSINHLIAMGISRENINSVVALKYVEIK